MLIRHAEKPDGDGAPGLMPNGVENPRALTLAGWKRANALVGLFNPPDGALPRPPLAKPRSLFASGSDSLRPKQTIAPLADGARISQSGLSSRVRSPSWLRRSRRPTTRFSFPGSTKRLPAIAGLDSWRRRAAFRRAGPATSTTSSGCSTFSLPAPGAYARFPNSSCRVTLIS